LFLFFFFFQAEDGIRDFHVTGVQTCALPIWSLVKNGPKPSPFLEYPPNDDITIMEWKDKGVWTVRDSEGQQILMDRVNGQLLMTNSGMISSTDMAQFRGLDGDGEYTLLDFKKSLWKAHARDLWEVYSHKDIKMTAEGDSNIKIIGNENLTVGGDKQDQIAGALTWQVGGDQKATIGGV